MHNFCKSKKDKLTSLGLSGLGVTTESPPNVDSPPILSGGVWGSWKYSSATCLGVGVKDTSVGLTSGIKSSNTGKDSTLLVVTMVSGLYQNRSGCLNYSNLKTLVAISVSFWACSTKVFPH